ncbi:DUF6906 family protein [Clostridium botulinum]|uniref:DUF6906 family protein n=1 Tax=Clostridium botulinum TaxID=1491 RepID=UPI0004D50329|nr:hypothetical protein [Clostridium botulinum]KEH90455.1 hypothetical protein Z963_p0009 [Clostridium botulinum C/D str. It1]
MRNLKKLSRNQKIALDKMGKNPKDYLRLTQDADSFTPVNIKTGKILGPVRY